MIVQSPEPLPLAPSVRTVLDRLRRRVRRYVWLEGLTAAVALLGAAFWLSLAIDWLFEPPSAPRALLLAAAALALLFVLVQLIVRRAFRPLSDVNMANALERAFPQLEDGLLTSVILAPRSPAEAGFDPAMLRRTGREAAQRVEGVELARVFNPVPLRRKLVWAILLTGSVAAFAVAVPDAMSLWARRSFLFSQELWPRKVRLEPVGFVDGTAKVARGADFDLVVKAVQGDTPLTVSPDTVEIRYRREGSGRERATMGRLGAHGDTAALAQFGHTFRGVLTPIQFQVFGGDAHPLDLRLEVVDSPTIDIQIERELPAYIGRPKRTVPATAGLMQFPMGSRLTLHARANKPLQSAKIEQWSRVPGATGGEEERMIVPAAILATAQLAADRQGFTYALGRPLMKDTTLVITLVDSDGIKSREPVRLVLGAVSDAPPQVAARLSGIGPAITPQARLPVAGEVTDDYGLDRVWFEYAVDKSPAQTKPVATLADRPLEVSLAKAVLEVPDLAVKVRAGQRLAVRVKARDLCDLGKGPNEGSSEVRNLEVVSPEELNSRLELQQLLLRQRFEAVVQEVTETQGLLWRMEVSGGSLAATSAGTAGGAHAAANDKPPAGAEPGEEAVSEEKLSPAERARLRKDRVEQAIDNCRKNAHETEEIAESFADIHQQMLNNRLHSRDSRTALDTDVVRPLQVIVQQMFPEAGRRLAALAAAVADAKLAAPRREAAARQIDDIVRAMRSVLNQMLKLEDFNELVEKLRNIIKLQEQVNEETKQRHKQQVRDLLEKPGT